MASYITRRILYIIPTILVITMVVFLFQDMAPGNAADALRGGSVPIPQERVESYVERFRLEEPIWTRYGYWLWNLFQGNLGRSLESGKKVSEVLMSRFGNTFLLMGVAIFLSTIIGVSIGIISGIWRYSVFDYVSTFIIFFSLSLPGFFSSFLAIYFFSIQLPVFPVGGSIGTASALGDLGFFSVILDKLYHLILPATTAGLVFSAYMARFTRTSIIEVSQEQYITTARAKGLSERVVLLKHVLRNALSPVITVLSNRVRRLVGGAVAVEIVFDYPGVGRLLRDAVLARDYAIIMGVILIFSTALLFSFLLADIGYALVNPKIRYE